MLKGNLDIVGLQQVAGWAWDEARPDEPVSLLITDNDRLIGRLLANRYRADLERAGIGSGRHGFELQLSTSLTPFEKHVVRVRREPDGTDLAQSPVTIEPTQAFDAGVQAPLSDFLQRSGSAADAVARIDFLVTQVDALLQKLADHDSKRIERGHYRQLLQRWRRRPTMRSAIPRAHLRALVIDDRMPRSDRDAGSLAILSHMRSLRRLGYEVVFAPAIGFDATDEDRTALDAIGVICCCAPYYGSIEEVLRRQAGEFDLVYLHRVSNALKYGELARHHNPKARRIFSVADLHHLRYARQASAEGRPELLALSQWTRFAEYFAALSANAVITHSSHEAEALARQIPASRIHTVRWSMTPRSTQVPFAQRRGLAFVGGYGHEPNLDAARWLIDEIMPLVRKRNPEIECLLVGSNMPEHLRRLCGDGVVAVGYVKDLAEIFDRVRLTVAPLTFGAGIKGKVIESLGAGLPCVCTPQAAEGFDFPARLQACVADGASALAELICGLHDGEEANAAARQAGLDYVTTVFSDDRLDAAMLRALGRQPRQSPERTDRQQSPPIDPGGPRRPVTLVSASLP